MQISERMAILIGKNFEQSDAVAMLDGIRALDERDFDGQDPDRIVGSIVILAMGNVANLPAILRSAAVDWRDLLMGAGLADDDWTLRVEEILNRGNM
jgi:hypothetical protein